MPRLESPRLRGEGAFRGIRKRGHFKVGREMIALLQSDHAVGFMELEPQGF